MQSFVDDLWEGKVSALERSPFTFVAGGEEVAPDTLFVGSFANSTAFATDDGIVMVDTGLAGSGPTIHAEIRAWRTAPLDTAVFTHGHVDHVLGLGPFLEEADQQGHPRPRIAAHDNLPARFHRYILTAGWNGAINARQFGVEGLQWPTEYFWPDLTYRDATTLQVGGTTFELHHGLGETDDATWVWVPDRRVLCTGDFFIWAVPNCGNPQKVQRYCAGWIDAFRAMAAKGAEVLCPGHGPAIVGAERIRQALESSADYLNVILRQTLERMNRGESLDEILHGVEIPESALPYLQPIYDHPEFIVRNIFRLYGGWHDGNPANLMPAPEEERAREIVTLAGGVARVLARAREVAEGGNLRLAGHLVQWAVTAEADSADAQSLKQELFGRRASQEPSLMARNVFRAAERDAAAALERLG